MVDFVQRIAGRSAKIGIQRQYLDGELHLVDNSLASGLHFALKFKIGQAIIQSIAVFVMHCLVFLQRTFEFVFHNFALHQLLPASAQVKSHVAAGMNVALWIYRAPLAAFVAALLAAEALLQIVASVTAPIFVAHHAALARFATVFTLESRRGFVVHLGQLTHPPILVQENL